MLLGATLDSKPEMETSDAKKQNTVGDSISISLNETLGDKERTESSISTNLLQQIGGDAENILGLDMNESESQNYAETTQGISKTVTEETGRNHSKNTTESLNQKEENFSYWDASRYAFNPTTIE